MPKPDFGCAEAALSDGLTAQAGTVSRVLVAQAIAATQKPRAWFAPYAFNKYAALWLAANTPPEQDK